VPTAPDITEISENLACEIAGLTPQKRRDWVKKGLLEQPTTNAKLSELQVVQLALLRELHDVLGSRDAGLAWSELRKQLSGRLPVGELDVVVDLGYREVTLVADPAALPATVRTKRPICVIPVEELLTRVRAAFRRVTSAGPSPSGAEGSSARSIDSEAG